MLEKIKLSLEVYSQNWEKLVADRRNSEFFSVLKPVAVGWKVSDKAEYDMIYEELRLQCDKIVETWMNDRWIAKLHLKQTTLPGGIEIIKLMQRRPNSDDTLGIDHVDFYSPAVKDCETILNSESNLKWTNETNEVVSGYGWKSIWFNETEAKLKESTVLDIVCQELQEVSERIKS